MYGNAMQLPLQYILLLTQEKPYMQQLLRLFLVVFIACGAATDGTAQAVNLQDTAAKKGRPLPVVRPKRPKAIDREFTAGLRLNTNGWGIFLNKGYVKSEEKFSDLFYDIRLFQVEFSEIKHTKEIKRTNTNLLGTIDAAPRPFIFGKVNNFYTLKLGYGFRKMIAGKPETGNISVHWLYMGGISLGLLKPYYIDYADVTSGYVEKSIRYTDSTKKQFVSQPNIIGSSGLSTGLSELSFVPGIHLKTGAHFDFALEKKKKLALETGFEFQYYSKAIELMAFQDAQSAFISFYASIEFGRRK